MSHLIWHLRRSTLPVLVVVCLAALTASFAYAEGSLRPLATEIIGDPDAAVTGKLAVGTAVPGTKSLTVAGVIDFVGAGTVHNFFTQGAGNNMQIRSNVDEALTVYDATKAQWNMVLGSANNMFMIKHSPAGATYNEDAFFWIQGSTGNVGIASFDTNNGALTPWAPEARLHVREATSTNAIYGESTVTSGYTVGARGVAASTGGDGVRGLASATTGDAWGVNGTSNSSAGIGVNGYASSATGATYGVKGSSLSTSGTGVYGEGSASTGTNTGVYGATYSPSGYGVYGYWPGSGTGWAGYFDGDVGVNGYLGVSGPAVFDSAVEIYGMLYKYGGGFRIDHPLDPSKYLSHSFVESPDMKNIYDGVVTLDQDGQAWVELPDWFEALNQDFRYQLTPIGGSMPDLHVAQGFQDNRFRIAGGVAGMEVSWQVTGIRHDTWAEENRIPVEQDKSESGMSGPSSKLGPQPLPEPSEKK